METHAHPRPDQDPQLERLSHATQVPAIRRIEEGAAEGQNGTELVTLHWGLIPFWAKGVAPNFGTIMATRERLATAPTWRGPWRVVNEGGGAGSS